MPAVVTYPVTHCNSLFETGLVINVRQQEGYVASMVTHIHKQVKNRLFLKENRKAKGISATVMAGRLGIERESVHRLEREPHRVDSGRQLQWADALGIEPEDLWRLPGSPSLDAIVAPASDEIKAMAADIVRRLVAGRR